MQAMIERIAVEGCRLFSKLDLQPNSGVHIVVGDNESGKSTLLELMPRGRPL
jgi:predicted ATP-dependent endonuclease of OLD family